MAKASKSLDDLRARLQHAADQSPEPVIIMSWTVNAEGVAVRTVHSRILGMTVPVEHFALLTKSMASDVQAQADGLMDMCPVEMKERIASMVYNRERGFAPFTDGDGPPDGQTRSLSILDN